MTFFAAMQLYLVNTSLSSGRVMLAVPLYMTSTIVSTMLSGAIAFDDLRDVKAHWRLETIAVSLLGITVGIITLTQQSRTGDEETCEITPTSSSRGCDHNVAPMTPAKCIMCVEQENGERVEGNTQASQTRPKQLLP